MPRPARLPIGVQLAQTQKAVSRAFAAAIGAAGASLPTWLVLVSLKTRMPANQRELADAVNMQWVRVCRCTKPAAPWCWISAVAPPKWPCCR